MNRFAELACCGQSNLSIALIVGISHIRKAWSETLIVWAHEWIVALQVDVIRNQYQRTLRVFRVDTAGSVGQDQRTNAHSTQNSRGKSDLARRISLIQVNPPLHNRDRN